MSSRLYPTQAFRKFRAAKYIARALYKAIGNPNTIVCLDARVR